MCKLASLTNVTGYSMDMRHPRTTEESRNWQELQKNSASAHLFFSTYLVFQTSAPLSGSNWGNEKLESIQLAQDLQYNILQAKVAQSVVKKYTDNVCVTLFEKDKCGRTKHT